MRLLGKINLKGRVVTGDALYAQRNVCKRILKGGGDYLLAVKQNQPRLFEDIALLFDEPPFGEVFGRAEQRGKRGDRYEVRRLWASNALREYLDWPGCEQVCKVERTFWRKGTQSTQREYLVSSLKPEEADPERLLGLRREHWEIENCLHYVRDVTLGEDLSQIRSGGAPQVMAALRNATIGLLRGAGAENIAAALREIAWKPKAALSRLGLPVR